jgi:hypothetical protein
VRSAGLGSDPPTELRYCDITKLTGEAKLENCQLFGKRPREEDRNVASRTKSIKSSGSLRLQKITRARSLCACRKQQSHASTADVAPTPVATTCAPSPTKHPQQICRTNVSKHRLVPTAGHNARSTSPSLKAEHIGQVDSAKAEIDTAPSIQHSTPCLIYSVTGACAQMLRSSTTTTTPGRPGSIRLAMSSNPKFARAVRRPRAALTAMCRHAASATAPFSVADVTRDAGARPDPLIVREPAQATSGACRLHAAQESWAASPMQNGSEREASAQVLSKQQGICKLPLQAPTDCSGGAFPSRSLRAAVAASLNKNCSDFPSRSPRLNAAAAAVAASAGHGHDTPGTCSCDKAAVMAFADPIPQGASARVICSLRGELPEAFARFRASAAAAKATAGACVYALVPICSAAIPDCMGSLAVRSSSARAQAVATVAAKPWAARPSKGMGPSHATAVPASTALAGQKGAFPGVAANHVALPAGADCGVACPVGAPCNRLAAADDGMQQQAALSFRTMEAKNAGTGCTPNAAAAVHAPTVTAEMPSDCAPRSADDEVSEVVKLKACPLFNIQLIVVANTIGRPIPCMLNWLRDEVNEYAVTHSL